MIELISSGQVTEEQSSDYEMSFTEYWWRFKCTCGNEIYYSHSYSVLGYGTKVKCEKCKKSFKITKNIVCGKA